MKILSNPENDIRNPVPKSSGYEWWYFDAVLEDGAHSFVVIFYEGNPFSARYIKALNDPKIVAVPREYPAVSISVYENGNPIYYSFTGFEQGDCKFSEDRPEVSIGSHKMTSEISNDRLIYNLDLEEKLPSGDQLEASLTFQSQKNEDSLFGENQGSSAGHWWNLVQPRADVEGEIRLFSDDNLTSEIAFQGKGYHDHNRGDEPMKKEFTDWYWGRFHFDYGTLVFYVMNRQDTEQYQGWLINKDNTVILDTFDDIELVDKGLSIFGLSTSRKITLKSRKTKVVIQQSRLLDNGPFYQRYLSDAFLRIPGESAVDSKVGITEYIRPDRIYARIFWPFVNMRIYYKSEGPHWVQRSKTLYRWTW